MKFFYVMKQGLQAIAGSNSSECKFGVFLFVAPHPPPKKL